jgi:hypothetical protein
MVFAVVRHAESIENADKYRGFYHDRRPYPGAIAHAISQSVIGVYRSGSRPEFCHLPSPMANSLG